MKKLLCCFLLICIQVCFAGPAQERFNAKLQEIRNLRDIETPRVDRTLTAMAEDHSIPIEVLQHRTDYMVGRLREKMNRLVKELNQLDLEVKKEKIVEMQNEVYKLEKAIVNDLVKNLNRNKYNDRKTEVMLSMNLGGGSYSAHMMHMTDFEYLKFHSKKLKELSSACLVGEELVETKDGLVAIQNVRTGDFVKTCLVDRKQCVYSEVKEVHERTVPRNHLIQLNFSNGKSTQITKNHLVYLANIGVYIEASKLKKNDQIYTPDNSEAYVDSVEEIAGEDDEKVYNLSVDRKEFNDKNYFVDGFLTHNCKDVANCAIDIAGKVRGLSLIDFINIFDSVDTCKSAYEKLKDFF